MKKKIFSIILGLSLVFLAILWHREQTYKQRLKTVNAAVHRMEKKVYLLNLKARALKMEIDMFRTSIHMKFIRNLVSVKTIGGKKND